MPDAVKVAAGTLLKMHDGATPGVFTNVAEVETIGAITEQRPEVNATPLVSDAVRYITGLKDGQEVEISMFLLTDHATQDDTTGVYSVFQSREARDFVVAPPGLANQIRFPAVITRHSMGPFNGGDPMRRVIGLRISGDVVLEENTNV